MSDPLRFGPDLSWYPWCPRAFAQAAQVAALSDLAELAYRRLLDRAWEAEGRGLPSDPALLPRLAGFSRRRWATIWPEIAGFFVEADGRLRNLRQEELRQAVAARRQKRVSAGRKGGLEKSRRRQERESADLAASRKFIESSSDGTAEDHGSNASTEPEPGQNSATPCATDSPALDRDGDGEEEEERKQATIVQTGGAARAGEATPPGGGSAPHGPGASEGAQRGSDRLSSSPGRESDEAFERRLRSLEAGEASVERSVHALARSWWPHRNPGDASWHSALAEIRWMVRQRGEAACRRAQDAYLASTVPASRVHLVNFYGLRGGGRRQVVRWMGEDLPPGGESSDKERRLRYLAEIRRYDGCALRDGWRITEWGLQGKRGVQPWGMTDLSELIEIEGELRRTYGSKGLRKGQESMNQESEEADG